MMFNLKPGFGKDDLRSHNYICHFTVFHKKLLEGEKEFYRKECDGSQDHDMVLRLTEKTTRITHIPKVLYYWRVHDNSVSKDLGTKLYAVDSAIRAIDQQLLRTGDMGKAASNLPFQTIYRITYELKQEFIVSLILHGTEKPEELEACIRNLEENTEYRNLELIYFAERELKIKVRDGMSLRQRIPLDTSKTKAESWNQAVELATGEMMLLFDARCRPIRKKLDKRNGNVGSERMYVQLGLKFITKMTELHMRELHWTEKVKRDYGFYVSMIPEQILAMRRCFVM